MSCDSCREGVSCRPQQIGARATFAATTQHGPHELAWLEKSDEGTALRGSSCAWLATVVFRHIAAKDTRWHDRGEMSSPRLLLLLTVSLSIPDCAQAPGTTFLET